MRPPSVQKFEVETPHYIARLVIVDGFVSKAAPILEWTIGRKWAELLPWFQERKFKVHPCR